MAALSGSAAAALSGPAAAMLSGLAAAVLSGSAAAALRGLLQPPLVSPSLLRSETGRRHALGVRRCRAQCVGRCIAQWAGCCRAQWDAVAVLGVPSAAALKSIQWISRCRAQ